MTTTKARIVRIEKRPNGGETAHLEWNGPDDRDVADFDIGRLGAVLSGVPAPYGGDLRRGWVALDGAAALREGDTIPLI